MHDNQSPDNTAVRVALWRALHVEAGSPPHVFEDTVGLKLAAPDDGWRSRPDMSPFTRPFRASIVARARFVEDLVPEEVRAGEMAFVRRIIQRNFWWQGFLLYPANRRLKFSYPLGVMLTTRERRCRWIQPRST
jgi:hypothetical protein